MNKVLFFQVFHGRGNLSGHVEQYDSIHLLTVTLTEVVQEVAVRHVLRHYVERRLQCAYT